MWRACVSWTPGFPSVFELTLEPIIFAGGGGVVNNEDIASTPPGEWPFEATCTGCDGRLKMRLEMKEHKDLNVLLCIGCETRTAGDPRMEADGTPADCSWCGEFSKTKVTNDQSY